MSGPPSSARPLTIFLVAGEESGDRLGAALIRALRGRSASETEFLGVGGAEMAREGLRSPVPISELSIIGVVDAVRRLPRLLRLIADAARAAIAAKPDALVIIDSPEFTHRIAKRVRRAVPSMPIIDYVSPSVWAWRPWRARAMTRYVDHVLALLPFEPEAHRRLGGPPCTYVGHPLSERVASLRPSLAEQRRRDAKPPLILVLPGSRRSEVRRLLPPFSAALMHAAETLGPMEVVLPAVSNLQADIIEAVSGWPVRPRVICEEAEKQAAFRSARAALAASGTVTLELALAKVPTVAAYVVSEWDAFIARRLIQVPTVILANLVLGENIVPEFLQEKCTPEALSNALAQIVSDTPERQSQIDAFARLDEIMQIGSAVPSERAADIVIAAARGLRMADRGPIA